MSSPSSNDVLSGLHTVGKGEYGRVVSPLKGIAFWTAIALPFLHLPLLVTGLNSGSRTAAFVVLLTLNVLTLLAGHPYGRE